LAASSALDPAQQVEHLEGGSVQDTVSPPALEETALFQAKTAAVRIAQLLLVYSAD